MTESLQYTLTTRNRMNIAGKNYMKESSTSSEFMCFIVKFCSCLFQNCVYFFCLELSKFCEGYLIINLGQVYHKTVRDAEINSQNQHVYKPSTHMSLSFMLMQEDTRTELYNFSCRFLLTVFVANFFFK